MNTYGALKPKPGKEETLRQLMRDHLPTLRSEKLVTDRPPVLMKAGDGAVIQVFSEFSPLPE